MLKTSSCRALAGTFQFRLQAIASDIGLGHGLPSLHTLLICARRILQVAAGVSLPAEANHRDALLHRDGSRLDDGSRRLYQSAHAEARKNTALSDSFPAKLEHMASMRYGDIAPRLPLL